MSSNFKMYLNMYQFDTKLPGSNIELKIKPITTGQLKKLLMYESVDDLGKVEEALDELITESVLSEGFSIEDIPLQDRFWLLVELRKITKGNLYTFSAMCEACNSQFMHTVDIAKLPFRTLKLPPKQKEEETEEQKEEKIEKGKVSIKVEKKKEKPKEEKAKEKRETENPWVVKLNDNISVEMSLVTRGIQKTAFNLVKNMTLTEGQKRLHAIILCTAMAIEAIITPEGKEKDISVQDKVYFLDNITQTEMEKIQAWLGEYDYGLEFTFDVKCPHCGDVKRREIPLEDFFF